MAPADSDVVVGGGPGLVTPSEDTGSHRRALGVGQVRGPRWWPWLLVLIGLVILCALGWLAYTGLKAERQSRALEATLATAEVHARALDTTALAADITTVQEQASQLRSLTSGPVWWAAAHVPWVGRDVEATRTIAVAADDIAASATGVQAVLPSLDPARLRAKDGRIDVAALSAAAPAFTTFAAALTLGGAQISALNPDGLVGPVADAVRRTQQVFAGAVGANDLAVSFAVLPALLGADGPRTWGVLLLNPAELRGGGGFFGTLAIVTADMGRLHLESVVANDSVVTNSWLPVSTLPAEYRRLWGASVSEWQSVNISPHFPYAAQLALGSLAAEGIKVDGIAALDTRVVAAVLAGTGPVSAGGFTVTSTTAEAFFTRGIYHAFPDGVGHDAVVIALLHRLFGALTTGAVDVRALGKAVLPLVDERRLLAWSAAAKEEAALAIAPVGGVLPDAAGPWTTVALVNGAGNKMDAYVTASVHYLANVCVGGTAPSAVTLRLTNFAPKDLPAYADQRLDDPQAPRGSTMLIAYVYGPVGATAETATLDGVAVPVTEGSERGHPVWRYDVTLLRGQTRTLSVHFTEPRVSGSAAPSVLAQPMANEEKVGAALAPCGA